jgi:SAM-dependent methyltransferase
MDVPIPDSRRLYGDLAWTWPIISPPEEYVAESEFFADLICKYSVRRPRTLLHLGCGGGHHDNTFKRRFSVTGVDMSPEMLALARRLNPGAVYVEVDMRTVRLGRTFDAVALLDSVNYMLSEADLEAAFKTASAHLEPGGIFLTTVEETRETFTQDKTRYLVRRRGDIEIAFIENMYDPDPGDTTYESTFVYLIRKGGRLSLETDRHLGGIFPSVLWHNKLEEVGFTVETTAYQDPDSREEIRVLVCTKGAT